MFSNIRHIRKYNKPYNKKVFENKPTYVFAYRYNPRSPYTWVSINNLKQFEGSHQWPLLNSKFFKIFFLKDGKYYSLMNKNEFEHKILEAYAKKFTADGKRGLLYNNITSFRQKILKGIM